MGNAIGKPRVSPLLSLNMMKVRNQPKLRRVMGNVDRTFWPKLLSNSRTNHSIFRWFLPLHWLFLDLFSALFDIFRLFCDTSFRFVSFRCISFRFISFSFLSLVVPYISFRFVILHFVSFRYFIFRFVSFRFVSFSFLSLVVPDILPLWTVYCLTNIYAMQ
jgi:hypothetical protein